MLHVVEKQATEAAQAAEAAHGVFHKARRVKDAASETLTKAAIAKAEIEAEEKERRERCELAATFDSRTKIAIAADDAFEAAERDREAKVDAAEAAKAEAASVRNDYAYADFIIATAIGKVLCDGEAMKQADLLAKLPAAIDADRDKQIEARMSGLGGYGVPLVAYDNVRDAVDWWIGQLRNDGPLVSISYRSDDRWKAHPMAEDMIGKAKGLVKGGGPAAAKAEAKVYLEARNPEQYEPIPAA